MDSTTTPTAVKASPGSFSEVLGSFVSGDRSLADVREIFCGRLQADPACGAEMQAALEKELKASSITVAQYKEIVEGINAILQGGQPEASPSENIPTETSEDAPDQPGFYHVDGEGTLILAEDDDNTSTVSPEESHDGVGAPQSAGSVEVGQVLAGRYKLQQQVAAGSMGVVYKAIDMQALDESAHKPYVAIKLISPEYVSHATALKTFQNEIDNARRLSHPHIVQMFELEEDGAHHFISMEWLEGESLDALLERTKGSALQPTQTYAIIEQLCDALSYAHEHDVIHADIKPGNVFLVETGELKLIDFGIAVDDPGVRQKNRSKRRLSGVALTPAYASCERLEKQAPTQQDDLFSLACLVYRLLSGRRVFGQLSALEAEQAGMEPVPISGIPDTRWLALRTALSFRREKRQESIAEFSHQFGRRAQPREPDAVLYNDTHLLEKPTEEIIAAAEATPPASPPAAPEAEPQDVVQEEAHQQKAMQEEVAQKEALATDISDATESHDEAFILDDIDALADMSVEDLLDDDLIDDFEHRETEDQTSIEEEFGLFDLDELGAESETSAEPSVDDAALLQEIAETTRREALNGTTELMQLAGVPEDGGRQHIDTTMMEPLNETAALHSLAGVNEQSRAAPSPKDQKLADMARDGQASPLDMALVEGGPTVLEPVPQQPDIELLSDTQIAGPATVDATTANMPAPPSGEVPYTDTLNLAEDPREQSHTDTINLEEAPAQNGDTINLETGAGLAQQPDSALPLSVPQGTASDLVVVPKDDVVAQQARANVRAAPAATPQGDSTDDPNATSSHNQDRVRTQLQGAGNRQTLKGEDDSRLQQMVDGLRAKPKMLAGIAAGIVALVGTAVFVLLGGGAASDSGSAVQPTVVEQAPPAGQPVVMDLSGAAPTEIKTAPGDELAPPVTVINEPTPVAEPAAPATASIAPPVSAPIEYEPVVDERQQQRIADIQLKVTAAIKAKRLTKPAGNNASHWVDELQAAGAEPAVITVASRELADAFIARAEQAYIDGDISLTKSYADKAEEYGADEIALSPIRGSILRFERRRAAEEEAAKLRAAVRPDPSKKASAAAEVARYQLVPFKELEFVRYVEPLYPVREPGKGGLSGWVELSFTVGEDGRTQNIIVVDTNLPPHFEGPALSAVKRWRVEPQRVDGLPIPVSSSVRLRFQSPSR